MKRVLKIFVVMLSLIGMITGVYAREVAIADNEIVQEGTHDSTRFVAGNRVTNKGVVDGLSFLAGNDVKSEGISPFGFFAGNNIVINDTIEYDLFAAGNNLTIGSDAILKRDVYLAGNTININANIGRDLRIGATSVDIRGITINGDVYIASNEVLMDKETIIYGKLTYFDDCVVKGLTEASINTIEVKKSDDYTVEISFKDTALDFIVSVLAAFVTMIVIFYIRPKSKEKLEKTELSFNNIAKNTGIGLLVLIVVPIISLFTLISGILTPITIITLLVYGISIYLSFLASYFVIGNVIIKKIIKNDNSYLALAIGIIVTKLIQLIPVIGGLTTLLILFYGLGLIFNYIKPNEK